MLLTLSREWHRNQSSCRQCSARWGCTCQRSSASEQTGSTMFLLLFVKLLLDVGCNVLLNVVLLQGLGGAVDSILRSKISFKIVSFTFNVLRSPPAASPRTCPHFWLLLFDPTFFLFEATIHALVWNYSIDKCYVNNSHATKYYGYFLDNDLWNPYFILR